MAEGSHPAYLSPSELGTKDYWESYYARTLAHISHDAPTSNAQDQDQEDKDVSTTDLNDEDDPGTSWFSEHNAPQKVLHFLTRKSFPLSPRNTRKQRTQPSVLDLGTGNGSMLALLRKKGGYSGRLVGVDYSRQSVELARELQRVRGHSAYRSDSEDEDEDDEETEEDGEDEAGMDAASDVRENPIQFEEWDILGSKALLSEAGIETHLSETEETIPWFPYQQGGFDIVLDKGTFDAVSLADDAKTSRVCERYPDIARRLVRRGGFLIVTTCNWTEEELVHWFTAGRTSGDRFGVWGRVEYPRFRFGGHEGQGVCTVCFQRLGDDA
ncbi:hypothetical protein N7535_001179 [Penicillium sp. DV-2018c]|nr:hypothetical protein N7535_001179 [Penicillium sp. DV-2018c]